MYSILFISFEFVYFTKYNELSSKNFSQGLKEALNEANKYHKITGYNIFILQENSEPSKVMFYDKINNLEYKKSVVWKNYPSSYLLQKSFLQYNFLSPYDNIDINDKNIYIAPLYTRNHFINVLQKKNINIKTFGEYITITPITL